MDTSQIFLMVCCGSIIFMLGFFTAALLAAAKREDIDAQGANNPYILEGNELKRTRKARQRGE